MPSIITLADRAVTAPSAGFPASARRVLALSLLDWSAVAVAGLQEPVAEIARTHAAAEGGRPEATALGLPEKLPARASAWVNGAVSHALDYDDTHFGHVGHTSVAVIPAALAAAERAGASGAAFLDAALIGSEAACRIGAWLGRAHYQAGFHQTATSGAFGAALAAARALGLSPDEARHAVGLVSTRAAGLKSQFGTMGKPLNAGFAAANGVEAALLAAAGAQSCADGLAGPQGFAAAHHGEMGDAAPALEGYGEAFLFEQVSHKLHACCHGLHAALSALGALRAELLAAGGALAEIAEIRIETNPRWLSVCAIAAPTSALEAKFSYALTAAMALRGDDTAALAAFTDAQCRDPALTVIRDRVRVIADPALSDTAARVTLRLASGAERRRDHDLAAPAPIGAREDAVRRKAEALIGAEATAGLAAAIEALKDGPLDGFTDQLRKMAS